MLKIATKIVLALSLMMVVLTPVDAHAGRWAELRKIKAAGHMDEYRAKKAELAPQYRNPGALRRILKVAAKAGLAIGLSATALPRLGVSTHDAVHLGAWGAVLGTLAVGVLRAGVETADTISQRLQRNAAARQAIIEKHGL